MSIIGIYFFLDILNCIARVNCAWHSGIFWHSSIPAFLAFQHSSIPAFQAFQAFQHSWHSTHSDYFFNCNVPLYAILLINNAVLCTIISSLECNLNYHRTVVDAKSTTRRFSISTILTPPLFISRLSLLTIIRYQKKNNILTCE